MKPIPYGRQYIDDLDIKSVKDSLKKEKITTGDYVSRFEKKISSYLDVKYATSCSSGTAALHLAFNTLDLKKNDNIIMPAINFIASYNICSLYKSKIFLADVDPNTGQMTPETLETCIKRNGLKKIKLVITMYLGGYPENIINFYKIKKKYNFFLIEDACHALGAQYLYKRRYIKIGSCKHSDICIFSLHPVKTITSGEGGLVLTNNKKIIKKINLLRSHGIERDKHHWKYNVKFPGFNYRLSDIGASLALSQLKKIEFFIRKRYQLSSIYKKKLLQVKNYINIPNYSDCIKSAYHLFVIKIRFKILKSSKDEFMLYMLKNKIICQYHYIPIYMFNKIFNKNNFNSKHFLGAQSYYKNSLSLPIYVGLTKSQINYICKIIFQFIDKRKII
jgi:dTDP-4-amino-4,6-dideoxygalactose transaminase